MRFTKILTYLLVSIIIFGCGDNQTSKINSKDKVAIALGFKNADEMAEIQGWGFSTKNDFEDVAFRSPEYCFKTGDWGKFYREYCEGKQIIWIASYESDDRVKLYFKNIKQVDLKWLKRPNVALKKGQIILFRGLAGPLNLVYPDVNEVVLLKVLTQEKAQELEKVFSNLIGAEKRALARDAERRGIDKIDFILSCSHNYVGNNLTDKANFISFGKGNEGLARFTRYKTNEKKNLVYFWQFDLKLKEPYPKTKSVEMYSYKVDEFFSTWSPIRNDWDSQEGRDYKYTLTIEVERDTLNVNYHYLDSYIVGKGNVDVFKCIRLDDKSYQNILDDNERQRQNSILSYELYLKNIEEIRQKKINEQLKKNKI